MLFCDIASFYSPQGGGITTYHEKKLEVFASQSKHRYIMIAPSFENREEPREGGTIYWTKGFRYDKNYYHFWDYRPLKDLFLRHRPDVIELGSPYLDYWVAGFAARSLHVVKTAYYHCDFPDTYVRPFAGKYLGFMEPLLLGLSYRYVKRIYSRLDATFVASDYIHTKLGHLGLNNLIKLPLGVDVEAFHPSRRTPGLGAARGIAQDDKILLYTGRLGADKGLDPVFDALPKIMKDRSMHMVFVGTGPYEPLIRRLSEKHGNIHYLGYVKDRQKLAEIYASATAYLSPGTHETFGLGIAEALASGIPVLAADSGAGVEFIRKYGCGMLFKPGDEEDFSKKVRDIMSADFSNGLRAVREFLVSNHDWTKIFQAYITHHEKLAQQKS